MSEKAQQNSSYGGHNTAGGCDAESIWRTVTENVEYTKGIIGKFLRFVLRGIESEWPRESEATFVLWICSIIIDPFVLYVPRINDETEKSLDFDRSFLAIISVLYFVISFSKILLYLTKKKKIFEQPKLWYVFVLGAPFVPIFTNALLQILLLFKSTTNIKASLFSIGMLMFLFLYLARLLGIYKLFIATTLRESAVLRTLNNLLLYFYGGHLFGGLWYFFSVWKKMRCWYISCCKHIECHYENRHFFILPKHEALLADSCSKDEMGIFKDAITSRIINTKNLGKKFLYSLTWAIQNLSNYSQTIQVSTHAWENIFVLVIAVYGMITFTFFIGNMQDLLGSPTRTRWRKEDLQEWSPFKKLSTDDQNRILKKCEECNWRQSGVVNLRNLVSHLPNEEAEYIKRILFTQLLKQAKDSLCSETKEFPNWSDELIEELSGFAKIVSYEEHTQLVKKGSPIEEMVLLVEGKLRIYTFTDGNTVPEIVEKQEGICGEELFPQFPVEPPESNKIIQTVGPVDAFVVVFYDLQYVMNRHNPQPQAASGSTQDQASDVQD